ncbi:peroxisomal acyl-coenzyme A oxidase 2 [Pelodiscus sinensis]|uniref:peroxisomal acyl-coenzyme A oxidase 2 n=1 Tax=Pelodiscus sinensis TaxID=13735 RepID=UPI003F6D5D59
MAQWNRSGYFRSSVSRDVNPDLKAERRTASFSVERLTAVLDGGADNTRTRRAMEAVIHRDPVFSREKQYFQSQNERYEAAVRKAVRLKEKMLQRGWTENRPETKYFYRALGGDVAFNVHRVFKNSILALGTDEQIAKWIPLAEKYHIIGTYAQTELGHGTFLRGLETTATFDTSTQEFTLNTPRISAMKWWPGDLGRSATHAVVFAQLYVKGECYGLHPFIVQIRSLRDHLPAPGVTVGDIGPKMNFEHIDNGYLMLQSVTIPRENMLGRFSQVLPDGTYVKRGSDKINYLTMIVTRVEMLWVEVIPALQKACTISVRYSVVRRQSKLNPGEAEAKILDYQTQQQKLLPLLATAYALHFMNAYVNKFYSKGYTEIREGNFDSLPELHALTSGLKAIITDYCTAGAEVCLRACGGHGYSALSGLPFLYTKVAASCTYEGDNTVLFLQTARYLVKCLAAVHAGQPTPPSVAYLSLTNSGKCWVRTEADLLKPDIYAEAYRRRASRLLSTAAAKLQALIQSGAEEYVAWNRCTVQLVQAAKAHCQYIIVKNFIDTVEKLTNEAEIQKIMKHLCDLFALHGIFSNTGDFLHDGYISGDQMDLVTASYLDLLAVIRSDAVPLVDAFDFTDENLNSALGSYDGHVYQRLYEWAQKSPTNQQVSRAYESYLKPLFQGALSKL